MLEIKDSVAVITGGASGIGFEMAKFWVQNGGKVVLADIAEQPLIEAAGKIDGDVATITCNVTDEADCAKLAEMAIEKFGQINLVAPFAGIIKDGMTLSVSRDSGKVKRKMALDQFKLVVDVNLNGVFLTIRECAEQMINHNCKGLICLVSSTGSLGTAGQINYASTKAAMSVMPKVITAEFFRLGLADKIRCVAVAPGYVGTPMVKGMPAKILDKIMAGIPFTMGVPTYPGERYAGQNLRQDYRPGTHWSIS